MRNHRYSADSSLAPTDEVLLKNKKFSHHLESLEVRQQSVRRFIDLLKPQIILDTPPLQVRHVSHLCNLS